MQLYNKIMLYFWLAISIFLFVALTYLSITDDFMKWRYYYIIPVICLGMYFLRRYMIKRFERHVEWLEKQKDLERK